MAENKKILIADDDADIVEALKIMLDDDGYETIPCIDGRNVEELVAKNTPDLILLDIWMSGMDGRDICRSIKKNPSTENIPVILVSANRDTEQMAKECGADDFIAKPFEMSLLLEKAAKYT